MLVDFLTCFGYEIQLKKIKVNNKLSLRWPGKHKNSIFVIRGIEKKIFDRDRCEIKC